MATRVALCALSCLSAAIQGALASISFSPSEIEIVPSGAGAYVETLTLTNDGSTGKQVTLTVQEGQQRRRLLQSANASLQAHVLQVAKKESARRLTSEEEATPVDDCSAIHRLILKIRGANSEGGGRRLEEVRRRLSEQTQPLVTSWIHLRTLKMDIADIDCDRVSPRQALNHIRENFGDELEFVELDQRVYPVEIEPNDPRWSDQWQMARIKVGKAWEQLAALGKSPRTTVVGVLDTGLEVEHDDLADMVWTNPGEIPNNGIDDDGNGYIDDVHGYSFIENNPSTIDRHGHGTHCAGVIAASTNNGIGIGGIGGLYADVKLMGLKFMDTAGGSISDALRGLEYAVYMGAPISSNSWGGGGSSSAFASALASAPEHLFVAAAGNSAANVDNGFRYPCCYSASTWGLNNVMCVASTTESEALSSFSNYGSSCVQIAAPGSSILSTYRGNSYSYMSGTSMACPAVSGAAALAYSNFHSLEDAGDVLQALANSAEVEDWLVGKVSSNGILDVDTLVENLAEAESWAWLKTGGGASLSATVQVPSGGSASIDVEVRVGSMAVGTRETATIGLEWPGGSSSVPVAYTVEGTPLLATPQSSLEYCHVAVGSNETLFIGLQNQGTGTLRYRLAAQAPFTVIGGGGVMRLPPFGSTQLDVACVPGSSGSFVQEAVLYTNSGVDPDVAQSENGVNLGTQFTVTLSCSSQMRHLTMDYYSGAAVFPSGTLAPMMEYLDPSTPAMWESGLAGSSVTAPLVIGAGSNFEGCLPFQASAVAGNIVLVSSGACHPVIKTLNVQAAGGLGVLIYDDSYPVSTTMTVTSVTMTQTLTSGTVHSSTFTTTTQTSSTETSSTETKASSTLTDTTMTEASLTSTTDTSSTETSSTVTSTTMTSTATKSTGETFSSTTETSSTETSSTETDGTTTATFTSRTMATTTLFTSTVTTTTLTSSTETSSTATVHTTTFITTSATTTTETSSTETSSTDTSTTATSTISVSTAETWSTTTVTSSTETSSTVSSTVYVAEDDVQTTVVTTKQTRAPRLLSEESGPCNGLIQSGRRCAGGKTDCFRDIADILPPGYIIQNKYLLNVPSAEACHDVVKLAGCSGGFTYKAQSRLCWGYQQCANTQGKNGHWCGEINEFDCLVSTSTKTTGTTYTTATPYTITYTFDSRTRTTTTETSSTETSSTDTSTTVTSTVSVTTAETFTSTSHTSSTETSSTETKATSTVTLTTWTKATETTTTDTSSTDTSSTMTSTSVTSTATKSTGETFSSTTHTSSTETSSTETDVTTTVTLTSRTIATTTVFTSTVTTTTLTSSTETSSTETVHTSTYITTSLSTTTETSSTVTSSTDTSTTATSTISVSTAESWTSTSVTSTTETSSTETSSTATSTTEISTVTKSTGETFSSTTQTSSTETSSTETEGTTTFTFTSRTMATTTVFTSTVTTTTLTSSTETSSTGTDATTTFNTFSVTTSTETSSTVTSSTDTSTTVSSTVSVTTAESFTSTSVTSTTETSSTETSSTDTSTTGSSTVSVTTAETFTSTSVTSSTETSSTHTSTTYATSTDATSTFATTTFATLTTLGDHSTSLTSTSETSSTETSSTATEATSTVTSTTTSPATTTLATSTVTTTTMTSSTETSSTITQATSTFITTSVTSTTETSSTETSSTHTSSTAATTTDSPYTLTSVTETTTTLYFEDLPEIPGFFITRWKGLELISRLAGGESLDVHLAWMPLDLWTGSPTEIAEDAIELRNTGEVDLTVSMAAVRMGFGIPKRHYYTAAFPGGPYGTEAPVFQWHTPKPSAELTDFRYSKLDDGGVMYTLPFSFPFFSKFYTSVFISANGLLIFEPGYTGSSGEASSPLPSTASPNGVVAAFWDDLICTASTYVYAEAIGETLVVQWADIAIKSGGTASFEVRLGADGQITANYLEVTELPPTVKVGVEAEDGDDGFNVALALAGATPFAISFTPWVKLTDGATNVIQPGGSYMMPFLATGKDDMTGYMTVEATDACGAGGDWTASREARIVKNRFRYTYVPGSWGQCIRNCDTDPSTGTQTRPIHCVGSDNKTYGVGNCTSMPSCKDHTGWEDNFGFNCKDYVYNAWCTDEGGYGRGWPSSWGTFAERAESGRDATDACCSCGGGLSNDPPPATQICTNPIGDCGPTTVTMTSTTVASTTLVSTTLGARGCMYIMTERAEIIKATECSA